MSNSHTHVLETQGKAVLPGGILEALSCQPRLIPLAKPNAPRLSENVAELAAIENSFRLSNYGPVNERLEREMRLRVFAGAGRCLTVCNATIGLILALKLVSIRSGARPGGLVLMPSLTFAAAAHAVLWAGLTPLLVDVDKDNWASSHDAELRLLERYGERIVAVMPYAAFGDSLDLAHYDRLSQRYGVPVIIDAAASLGTLDGDGAPFGAGSKHIIVYSMHATKAFAVGEGGLIYSADEQAIEQLRSMGNFGFNGARSAVTAGLNSKISEVAALSALVKLRGYEANVRYRAHLADCYRQVLWNLCHQKTRASRIPYQFMPVLLPADLATQRDAIIEASLSRGITLGKYFSPHVREQPYFKEVCVTPEPLPNTEDVAARILSLPMSDSMTVDEVRRVATFLEHEIATRRRRAGSDLRADHVRRRYGCLIAGGGPAALAPLVAASREGSLADVLDQGMIVVERSPAVGAGRIGSYVIHSDSTAASFLTAVEDHADHRLGALLSTSRCDRLRRRGIESITLKEAAQLENDVGCVLQRAIHARGGRVCVGHEAVYAQQTEWGWRTRVRDLASDTDVEIESRSLVLGTGGYQPISRLFSEPVAGVPLLPRFGSKVVQSDEVLADGGLDRLASMFGRERRTKVAIVGGSTSALAVADLLTTALPDQWGAGDITILHRRPLRVFFPSAEAAMRTGYTAFGPEDICPVTGFVFRLAGARQQSRKLLMRVLGVGEPRSEFRVVLQQIRPDDFLATQRVLDEADVIIAALGYRPRAFSLLDRQGDQIGLLAEEPRGRLVDDRCRVLDREGRPIDGVFGIGLASGFELDASMGGEASFEGQANGLWLWQNHIGLRLIQGVLERCRGVLDTPTADVLSMAVGETLLQASALVPDLALPT